MHARSRVCVCKRVYARTRLTCMHMRMWRMYDALNLDLHIRIGEAVTAQGGQPPRLDDAKHNGEQCGVEVLGLQRVRLLADE